MTHSKIQKKKKKKMVTFFYLFLPLTY